MKIDVLGVNIDCLTWKSATAMIEVFLGTTGQKYCITANPEIILKAVDDSRFRTLINRAALVTTDGSGLIWAAEFLSLKKGNFIVTIFQAIYSALALFMPSITKMKMERIAGVDLMDKICGLASKKKWKICLLGGRLGIAEAAAKNLKNKYLDLSINFFTGPLDIDSSPAEKVKNMIRQINQDAPDILFVAYGAPKQEKWIEQNLNKLPSVKLAMGVGGAFDYISGSIRRAPAIYRELNLEWLFRLFIQPWRLQRIFNATVKFVFNVVKYKQFTR